MHGLSSYINKVYHGFSQGAPTATPQIVYSFDTFVMTVKVFAAMTGENAELFTSQSGALVCMGVCPQCKLVVQGGEGRRAEGDPGYFYRSALLHTIDCTIQCR